MDVIEQRLKEPLRAIDQKDGGKLLVFLPAKTGENAKEYIIGVDPAGGGAEGDYSGAQGIDRGTRVQCAELRGHFSHEELAEHVASLARDYNHALVAVERNNHGHAVLVALALNNGDVDLYQANRQRGWLTSAATRPRMLGNFAAVLAAAPFLFASPRLWEGGKTFVQIGRAA